MEQFRNIFGRVLRRVQSSGIKMESGMQQASASSGSVRKQQDPAEDEPPLHQGALS